MKRLVVLGSTGSIGTQTLNLVARLRDEYQVVGLGAGHWSPSLSSQVAEWQPSHVAVASPAPAPPGDGITILRGSESLEAMVEELAPDVLVVGTPGLVALGACIASLRQGAIVLIANKETLVSAGSVVSEAARLYGGTVIPVDSEHSGIWQCLRGERMSSVSELVLTSSGGALRDRPLAELRFATAQEALRHPTWSMGPKITVDSATLMNKGLEIIEASWLFGVPASRVSVVLHRQSIVHALVEFKDGSLKAQLSVPDMRLAILYGLSYPERPNVDLPRLDLVGAGALTFEAIDEDRYPAVALSRQAAGAGGTYPAVLNAANEVAVEQFLHGAIGFMDIVSLVKETLGGHQSGWETDLPSVIDADRWAREACRGLLDRHSYSIGVSIRSRDSATAQLEGRLES
ncbi:MAG: 1-deoxy-D-xylulose-5-phosphate reductoisomerase [Chloroflexi bacterium]|nr:1-deoxy-D-xylulose-5-phosphate reductoisomerase [Chloroflexota bacterium]